MQFNKVNPQQKGRNNATVKQRKWSDWSECQVSCVKVRHRFICDDILSLEQEKNRTKSIKIISTSSTTTTERSVLKRNQQTARDEDLFNGPEDDYADDGDEIEPEIDNDLCDKVDTSKTFEEIPCTGGLCKVSNLINPATPATTTSATPYVIPKQRHNQISRNKASASDKDSKEAADMLVKQERTSLNSYVQQQRSHSFKVAGDPLTSSSGTSATRNQFNNQEPSPPHSNLQQTKGENPLRSAHSHQQHRHNQHHHHHHHNNQALDMSTGEMATPFNSSSSNLLEPSIEGIERIRLGEEEPYPSSSTPSTGSSSDSIWMKTIWPSKPLLAVGSSSTQTTLDGPLNRIQFGPGGTVGGQEAILIQWTILIGSLLAVILLILLILRKLIATAFPSYNWMLAKQMIRTTSNRLGINSDINSKTDGCCNSNGRRNLALPPHHRCFTSSSQHKIPFTCSSTETGPLLLAETANQSPTSSNHIQNHLICYNCHKHHNKNNNNNNSNSHRQQRQQMASLDNNNNFFGNDIIHHCATSTSSGNKSNKSTPTNGTLQCVVDVSGRHALGNGNSNNLLGNGGNNNIGENNIIRFNTDHMNLITPAIDPPSYVYAAAASMTRSSASSRSDTRGHNYYTINNNNYSNDSLGYDDPVNLIPEREKAYIIPGSKITVTGDTR